ncbi:bifunctional DNA primase/polymerase [Streptomyces qinzhouensis]|uniref:DNA primase n=1 Tax=Streptomyces qinzhouensis TaxID=2599401 RepID=A0A5B8JBL5_9ACTN|nr:bifunctional DNA primase/polymerase [Streptomyces qinzhouensis]QDY79235.1 DNA primase [Streptomyces qinzhouensis]
MGFTIGGSRGIRDIRSARPGSRRRGRAAERAVTAVAEYTGLWGWAVMPGAGTPPAAPSGTPSGGCSCGDGGAKCPAPGVHPLPFAAEIPAGATLDEVGEAWSGVAGAAVLLPVGRSFDVLDVAAGAGRRALVRMERMGLPLGPVTATPDGRCQFFVAPGAASALPELLYRMGWDDADLDLHCPGPGEYIAAPPSEFAGLGPVDWLRPPSLDTAAAPPEARLLLGTLAYICHRSAARGCAGDPAL